jgi:hypothetical protein
MQHISSTREALRSLGRIILLFALLTLTGCGGGGGGGDDFIGAAEVSLDVEPRTIDTVDRMRVRTTIFNVNENGIALKFRFPIGLAYVEDSASVQLDDNGSLAIKPRDNQSTEEFTYLVFYLPQDYFGNDGREAREFEMQLVASAEIESGQVEVDPDIDDPQTKNSEEFDIENPGFGAEDAVSIRVVN